MQLPEKLFLRGKIFRLLTGIVAKKLKANQVFSYIKNIVIFQENI